ncbi:DinB family protein [Catalinimonas niigatensis]|uniref:DinB family protein n=1 Tax=Catalinimonas niigatensis TaxID=1397264 RepID=UPI00266657B8|nr:DinB family protein [Catalinimonas niigatensis]WPP52321.1 DinB family protein [Catalinimonas niigatensis]
MENKLAAKINQAIVEEFERRVMGESIPRIKKCLSLLNEEEVWHRPNENVVSVGNLILHLCGNARQWILSGVGGRIDHRDRDSEFEETGPIAKDQLIRQMDQLVEEMRKVLLPLKPENLLEKRPVQIYEESVLSILVHVIEHFSYHTGQITFITKWLKNVDTQYYEGIDLNKKE